MMLLPSLEDLNCVSNLMHGGLNFERLQPQQKAGVVAIAQQAVLAHVLDDLPTQISIGFAETVASWPIGKLAEIAALLDTIDDEMKHVGHWFQKSRLYEP